MPPRIEAAGRTDTGTLHIRPHADRRLHFLTRAAMILLPRRVIQYFAGRGTRAMLANSGSGAVIPRRASLDIAPRESGVIRSGLP
jgi:hypothetical protein